MTSNRITGVQATAARNVERHRRAMDPSGDGRQDPHVVDVDACTKAFRKHLAGRQSGRAILSFNLMTPTPPAAVYTLPQEGSGWR